MISRINDYDADGFLKVLSSIPDEGDRLIYLNMHRENLNSYKFAIENDSGHDLTRWHHPHIFVPILPEKIIALFQYPDYRLAAAMMTRLVITDGTRLANVIKLLEKSMVLKFTVGQDAFSKSKKLSESDISYIDNCLQNIEQVAMNQKLKSDLMQAAAKGKTFQQRLQDIHFDGDIPNDLTCPISADIMNDPVTISTGITYDRLALTQYVESVPEGKPVTCPVTKIKIGRHECIELMTSITLKNQIDGFVKDKEEAAKKAALRTSKNGLFGDQNKEPTAPDNTSEVMHHKTASL